MNDDDAKDQSVAEADAEAAPRKSKRARRKDDQGPSSKKEKWTPAHALPARIAFPLAFLSGFLYFLGFPGIDVWPLSLVALAPLIVALRRQPPRRAAALGWLAGFTMTMTGFYWLLQMLRVFSGFPTALCLVFMALLCGYQGGRIALCGWLYGHAEARGWPPSVVFALAFAASELVFPLLFPWYFGASVHNAPALMQVADLGGPILVGLVLVAANLGVAELFLSQLEHRPIDKRLVGVGAGVPVLAAIYGVIRLSSVEAAMQAAEPVTLALVQGNMPLFDRDKAMQVYPRRTHDLKRQGVDLVVWSEAAIPRAFAEPNYKAEISQSFARYLGVPTVVGTVLYREEGESVRFFNVALMSDEQGAIVGRYDKQYLLTFGEYLPLGETFPILYKWSPNSGRFTPGTSIEPLVWKGHRISPLICYEDILPTFVNKIVDHADPDLLVNMTNDAWFGDSTEPWIHLALSKLRAVEHRRFLARTTNSGVSAVIDATGRVVAHGGTFHEETVIAKARFMRSKTVFELVGDIPWWLATAAIVFMSIRSRPKSWGVGRTSKA